MAVRFLHPQQDNSIYFITFTCHNWLPLIERTNAYDAVYKWFDYLHEKDMFVAGYVVMPNHVHALLYFPHMPRSLNTVIGNAKRFLAYELIGRLEAAGAEDLLQTLYHAVPQREKEKGQRHKVFEESFEARECYSKEFILQKLDYIHRNPVRGKWQLAADYTQYLHSSAGFYEGGQSGYGRLVHVGEIMY